MTTSLFQFGAQIATEVHEPSQATAQRPQAPTTLQELLDILEKNPPTEFPTLRTTCSWLAEYLEEPIDRIMVDTVNDRRDGFRAFLAGRPFKENTIRSYVNHARILLKHASELGWKPSDVVSEDWRSVVELASVKGCKDLAKYLSRSRKSPTDVALEDVDDWIQMKLQQGSSYAYINNKKTRFWRILRDCGCTEQTPTCFQREKHYGVPLDQFPESLKNEVLGLLKWKRAEFVANRPESWRHRKVSSDLLQDVFCGLFGFATNIHHESGITSLPQLVREEIVSSYLEWRINERRVKGYGIRCALRLLSAAMRQHPSYKSMDFGWFKPLLNSIPIEPKAEVKKRKAQKYLEYEVIESIPAKILAERRAVSKNEIGQNALLTRNALLMRWIITLPWRQLNVRKCRINGQAPNLFKGKIPAFSGIDKPEWVKQQERQNPAAEFWQFRFSTTETKTGIDVHSLLPRQLIGLLEEYLNQFRPHLLHGADPGTLFVTRAGKTMRSDYLGSTVSQLTMKFGGRRVTPHLFRDIVAYTWLKAHPEDYLTLSKMLWHSNINTTIETYGSRFNESSGVCAMESWLEDRQAKSK
ncbi:MAG: hypothetical protein ACLQBK_00505 [Candidatus Sulfotelmatobacter sp.]